MRQIVICEFNFVEFDWFTVALSDRLNTKNVQIEAAEVKMSRYFIPSMSQAWKIKDPTNPIMQLNKKPNL